jgi:hypothetical protein
MLKKILETQSTFAKASADFSVNQELMGMEALYA